MFRLFEELAIFNGNGSKEMVFLFFSNFFKLLNKCQARMNNRMGKAETKLVLVQDKLLVGVVK